MNLMEKVAEVAPEKYDFLVKTAAEVKESPFRDEIVNELKAVLEKGAANWAEFAAKNPGTAAAAGSAGKFMGGVAVAAMGGIGMALAGDAYDVAKRGLSKTRDYKRMLASNPDLKEKPALQVQSIFSTLHRFNPEFASDPVVSGSFVRNHVDLAGPEGAGSVGLDSLKSLVDARKGLNESRRLPQMPHSGGSKGGPDPELVGLQKRKLHQELGTKPPNT